MVGEYVFFSEKIDDIIEKTVVFGELTQLEDITAETFALVMGMRGKIKERINQLRSSPEKRGEVREEENLSLLSGEMLEILVRLTDLRTEDHDKLREVSQRLLGLRERQLEIINQFFIPNQIFSCESFFLPKI